MRERSSTGNAEEMPPSLRTSPSPRVARIEPMSKRSGSSGSAAAARWAALVLAAAVFFAAVFVPAAAPVAPVAPRVEETGLEVAAAFTMGKLSYTTAAHLTRRPTLYGPGRAARRRNQRPRA